MSASFLKLDAAEATGAFATGAIARAVGDGAAGTVLSFQLEKKVILFSHPSRPSPSSAFTALRLVRVGRVLVLPYENAICTDRVRT